MQAENESLKQQLEELQKQCGIVASKSSSKRGGSGAVRSSSGTLVRGNAAAGSSLKERLAVSALQTAGLLAYFLMQDKWLRC